MKYILCIIQLLSLLAIAGEKPPQKDFSKYEKIDTSQFVDINRKPTSKPSNGFHPTLTGCRDKEGRLISPTSNDFETCTGGRTSRGL